MCVDFERSGFWEGKTAEASDQTISAKTIAQLQLRPILMPAMRPRVNVGFRGGCLLLGQDGDVKGRHILSAARVPRAQR
jgi:hypothetical protein